MTAHSAVLLVITSTEVRVVVRLIAYARENIRSTAAAAYSLSGTSYFIKRFILNI